MSEGDRGILSGEGAGDGVGWKTDTHLSTRNHTNFQN